MKKYAGLLLVLLLTGCAGPKILLTAFAAENLPGPVDLSSVELLGSATPLDWDLSEEGLSIILPQEAPDMMAVVFKIETR